MPRRFLLRKIHNTDRSKLINAVIRETNGPSAKMLIAEMAEKRPEMFSQQIVKQSEDLPCLKAWQPVMMSQCMGSDGAVLPPAIDIVVEPNAYYLESMTPEMRRRLKNATGSSSNISFIDFTNPEDLLDFSARNNQGALHNIASICHPIVRKAKAMPAGFMKQILDQFKIPPKAPLCNVNSDGNTTVAVSGMADSENYPSYTCSECKQQFSALHLYQSHFLTHPDPDNKRFLCQVCGKRFSRADHLNRHAQLHTDIKVHKCILCGEEFARASHLDKHRRRTHVCNTSALDPKNITNDNLHLLAAVASPESAHTFQLQQIGQSQNRSSTSFLTAESIDDNAIQISVASVDGDNEVECHTEPERPFPCGVCGRKFIRATHLRRHMRIHTGEKPFFCHICGRRYARGDYLRAHIHAHRREKFHKCRVCGEVYHDLSRFSNHCLSHNESEFLEASLRESKRRAENKLTQKLSSGRRVDLPQTAEPAAPAVTMPTQTDLSSFMPEVNDAISEICVSPIENPMHFVDNHECSISSTVNHIQYQPTVAPTGGGQASVLAIPISTTNVNDPQQQQHLIIDNTERANSSISSFQVQIASSDVAQQGSQQQQQQCSVPQNQIVTLPTPQDTPTQSPELSHLSLSYLQSSSATSSHPPPLQMAVATQPNLSNAEILQHYSLVKSFNNQIMLIAPPVNLSTNGNYNNSISTTSIASSNSYFPTPSASPMVYQGLSLAELRSDILNHS